jgi:hypothetical protein
MNVDIKDKIYKSISEYCRTNHLVIKDYINDLLNKSFMRDKYGDRPFVSERPVEVEIEVKKNEETKEYEVEMKETTIPIETDTKPKLQTKWNLDFKHDEASIHATETEKEILKDAEELSKLKETVKIALAAKQKPSEEITIDAVKQAIESVQEDEPVEEKPKRRKLK